MCTLRSAGQGVVTYRPLSIGSAILHFRRGSLHVLYLGVSFRRPARCWTLSASLLLIPFPHTFRQTRLCYMRRLLTLSPYISLHARRHHLCGHNTPIHRLTLCLTLPDLSGISSLGYTFFAGCVSCVLRQDRIVSLISHLYLHLPAGPGEGFWGVIACMQTCIWSAAGS